MPLSIAASRSGQRNVSSRHATSRSPSARSLVRSSSADWPVTRGPVASFLWARRSPAATILAFAAGGIALVLAGRYTVRRDATPRPAGPVFESFDRVTDEAGVETTPAISPDGKSVVYAKTVGLDTALYLLRVGSKTPQRLSGQPPAHDSQPAFFPTAIELPSDWSGTAGASS